MFLKRHIALCLSLVMLLSTFAITVQGAEGFSFQIIGKVFEYGVDAIGIAVRDVDQDFDLESFEVEKFVPGFTFGDVVVSDSSLSLAITKKYRNSAPAIDETGPGVEDGEYIILELGDKYDGNFVASDMGGGSDYSLLAFSMETFSNSFAQENFRVKSGDTVTRTDFELATEESVIYANLSGFEAKTSKTKIGDIPELKYQFYEPEDVTEAIPLVVWLHGGGEGGNGNPEGYNGIIQILGNEGGIGWVNELTNDPNLLTSGAAISAPKKFYVAAPQAYTAWDWAAEGATGQKDRADRLDSFRIDAMIKEIIADYNVDPSRIYVAGCSMGGGQTFAQLIHSKEYEDEGAVQFAGAFPICPAYVLTEDDAELIKDIPIWVFQAANDTTVVPEMAQESVQKLEDAGSAVKYTEYLDAGIYFGHWSWVRVLNNEDNVMEWLFEQQLDIETISYQIIGKVFDYGFDAIGLAIKAGSAALDLEKFGIEKIIPGMPAFNVPDSQAALEVTAVYRNSSPAIDEAGVGVEDGEYVIVELGDKENGNFVNGGSSYTLLNFLFPAFKNVLSTGFVVKNGSFAFALDAEESLIYTNTAGFVEKTSSTVIGEDVPALKYQFYEPEGVSGKAPLVVWLHGMGEGGLGTPDGYDGMMQILGNEGGVGWLNELPDEKFYIAAPQAYNLWDWASGGTTGQKDRADRLDSFRIDAMLRELIEEYDIDPDRIYIAGCSMGGGQTFASLIHSKEYADDGAVQFAGAFPICPAYELTEEDAELIKDIPMWIFQAANDTTVNPEMTRRSVALLEAAGSAAKYTEYEDVYDYNGHWSWVRVLNNEDGVIDWLFEQKLTADAPVQPPYNPPYYPYSPYVPSVVAPAVSPVPVKLSVDVNFTLAPKIYADELNKLGLLYGVGTDAAGNPIYDLGKESNRIEALAFVIRLLGLEKEALAYTGPNPFKDVPSWGARYAAFAYSRGIAFGIDSAHSIFNADSPVTLQEFTAFLLRVLKYSEGGGDFAYSQTLDKAFSVGLYTQKYSNKNILRSDAALSMVEALLTRQKNSEKRLLDTLVDSGVITRAQANAFSSSVTGK